MRCAVIIRKTAKQSMRYWINPAGWEAKAATIHCVQVPIILSQKKQRLGFLCQAYILHEGVMGTIRRYGKTQRASPTPLFKQVVRTVTTGKTWPLMSTCAIASTQYMSSPRILIV